MGAIALPDPIATSPAPAAGAPASPVESPTAADPPQATGDASPGGSGAPAAQTPANDVAKGDPAADDKLARAKAAGERAKADAARKRERAAADAKRDAEMAALRSESQQRAKMAEDTAIARDESRSLEERADALRRLGIKPSTIVQGALREGSPEAQLEALLEKRLGPHLQELQELRAWRDSQLAIAKRQETERATQQLAAAAKDASRYPNLAKQPTDVVLAAADNLYDRIPPEKRAGITAHDIFEFLEEQYVSHTNAAQTTTVTTPGSDTRTASAPNDKAGSATPRTITNDLASPRLSASSKSFDDMTLDEQKAEMTRQLKATLTK